MRKYVAAKGLWALRVVQHETPALGRGFCVRW